MSIVLGLLDIPLYMDLSEEPTAFIFRVTTELAQVDAAVIQRKKYIYILCRAVLGLWQVTAAEGRKGGSHCTDSQHCSSYYVVPEFLSHVAAILS